MWKALAKKNPQERKGEKRMRRMRRRIFRKFQSQPWCLGLKLGEEEDFSSKIFFRAWGGGNAKAKALPKLKNFLSRLECQGENLRVEGTLKMIGNGNGGGNISAPTYFIVKNYSWRRKILGCRKPSRVFREVKSNGNHRGNGCH